MAGTGAGDLSREFHDQRLRLLVNGIIPFSRRTVTSSIHALLETRSPFGSEEEVYGLTFLEMLNVITDLFSFLDGYFARGLAKAGPELLAGLLGSLMSALGDGAKLAGAGLTSSLSNQRTLDAIEQELKKLHLEKLTPRDYEGLQAVQDTLTYSLMKPYLPKYVQRYLKKLPQAVDRALKARLGPHFGRDELYGLAAALTQAERTYGNVVTATEEEAQKYSPMVLTPRRLFAARLEDLYDFPPYLIQRDLTHFVFIVVENAFLWVRKKELEFIGFLKERHPNVSGDSMERILADFLTRQQLVIDDVPPSGLQAVVQHHPYHFNTAGPVRLARNTREDIFAILSNPNQRELQVDLVANHADGFSVLAESKFVTSYANAEAYYYQGSSAKEAEQARLLKLTGFLNANPGRKSVFDIPKPNPVVPVFITNAIGPLFSVNDGVVKSSPFEVMRVEPFYRLVRDQLETGRLQGDD